MALAVLSSGAALALSFAALVRQIVAIACERSTPEDGRHLRKHQAENGTLGVGDFDEEKGDDDADDGSDSEGVPRA